MEIVDSKWTPYGDFGACSVSCGVGTQTRTRSCIKTDPCGAPCTGITKETRGCGKPIVDGKYTEFGEWSECSVSCGEGTQTRTRTCIKDDPCGKDCVGPATETRKCGKKVVACKKECEEETGCEGGEFPFPYPYPRPYPIPGCMDRKLECPYWARAGYCRSQQHYMYMNRMCCMSCQRYGPLYGGGMGIQYRNNKADQQTQHTNYQLNPTCKDEKEDCEKWASFGFCSDKDHLVRQLMATKCCRSCTDQGSSRMVGSSGMNRGRAIAYNGVRQYAIQWKKK